MLEKDYPNVYKVFNDYQNELIDKYNQKLGNNEHTLELNTKITDTKFELEIIGPEEVPYIEYGRKKGKFPPVPIIEEWVKKNITTELPRVKTLSYLIGRKISEEGVKGKHILEPLLQELGNKYSKLLDDALNKDKNNKLEAVGNKLKETLGRCF